MKQLIFISVLMLGLCTLSAAQGGVYIPEMEVKKQTLVKDLPTALKWEILELLDNIPEEKTEILPEPVVVSFREFYFKDTTRLLDLLKKEGITALDVRKQKLDDISKEDVNQILLDNDKLNVFLVTKKPNSLKDIYVVYLFQSEDEEPEWLFGKTEFRGSLTVYKHTKVIALDVFKK